MPTTPRKHLKVKGELIENNTRVRVTILEQSHRRHDFGVDSKNHNYLSYRGICFTHNGNRLCSWNSPSYDSTPGGEKWFYVLGTSEHRDEEGFTVPLDAWEIFKDLVERYNKHFSEPATQQDNP